MNNPSLFERAQAIFDQVCEAAPEDRDSVLSEACGPDAALRREVETLLAHDASAGDAVEAADHGAGARALAEAMAGQTLSSSQKAFTETPERIGPYRVIRKIGEGGMGEVFEAAQESLKRSVALKVIRAGHVSPKLVKRFEHEAFVLAQLQHPGIAHIYESGIVDVNGRTLPFFAMELIRGERITAFAKQRALTTHQRLELIARVCDAVQYAHQKGIIHRDIKPANILVVEQETGTGTVGRSTESSTVIDAIGQPKVLDFGIARMTDPERQSVTLQTEVGQLVGTLAYMSPKQIEGNSSDLDTRCDVYALGVILYEILAERHPYDLSGCSVAEAARRIQETEPRSLGALNPDFRGDVETIVAKALEKDRERRYGSAAELAVDIRRSLANEPISARPATTMYVISRFARRNKALVGGVVATFMMLLVALIGTGYGLLKAKTQRSATVAANEQLQTANEQLQTVIDYQSGMLSTVDVEQMGQSLFKHLLSEAHRLADENPQTAERLIALESMLSEINATTLASHSLDESILTQSVAVLDSEFLNQPELRAHMRGSLVEIYKQIGLKAKALEQARFKRQTQTDSLGPDHPETLAAWQTVCELLLDTESYEDAYAEIERLLSVQQRVLGVDHVDTLRSKRLRGVILVRLARYEEALKTLRETHAAFSRVVGPHHAETEHAQLDLGDYYLAQRDFDAALVEYQFVLQHREKTAGSEATDTLVVLAKVADVRFMQNQFDEALALLQRYSQALERAKGADHRDTLSSRYRLANILTQLGEYDESESIIEDTLERQRRALGRDNPQTVLTLAARVRLAVQTRSWVQAEKCSREALAISLRTLGPDNVRTLVAQNNLANVLLKSEQYDAAKRAGRSALNEHVRVLGAEHHRTLVMQQVLGKILLSAGDYEEAAQLLGDLVEVCRRKFSTGSIFAGSMGVAVNALIQGAAPVEAQSLAEELLRWCEQRKVGSATIGRCHLWIARAQYAQDAFDAAEESLVSALEHTKGTSAELGWPTTLARTYQLLIVLRRDPASDPQDLLSSFKTLREQAKDMLPEDRNPILGELNQEMRRMGIEPPNK